MKTKRFPVSLILTVVALLAAALLYGSQGRWVVVGTCIGGSLGVVLHKAWRRNLGLGVD